VMFLLFELAAKHNLDLDTEWIAGRTRKLKYFRPHPDIMEPPAVKLGNES